MNLSNQKRIAAEVLDVGMGRVWIDPKRIEDVSNAITREDIRHYVEEGAIVAKPKKGISRGRIQKREKQRKKGRQKGHGSRSGKKGARTPKKITWIKRIRALRDELKNLKVKNEIDAKTYRRLYRQAKGNMFHSRRHLREYIKRKFGIGK